jgi:hypothetical protein
MRNKHPWNRDICAAINIMTVAVASAYNLLPDCFKRKRRDEDDQTQADNNDT